MKPVVKWTLWQRRWSTLWWLLGISAFIFINMIFYPSFKNDADELQKSFENIPDTAVQLLGGSTDFFSPVGFLNSQIFFIMLPLLLGILAISLGSGLLAKEERDNTIEMLLARPISRNLLLTGKALSGLLILSIAAAFSLVVTVIIGKLVDLEVSAFRIVEVTFVCFLLALCWGSIAYVLSASGRARAASLGIATVIALGGYIISSLAGTVDWLKGISKVFPFHYYQSEAILRNSYDWLNISYFVAVIFVCGLASWLLFRRRDLQ